MLCRHDPTFYVAICRLPRDLRSPTYALYGYVRVADEIVDGPRRAPTPTGRRAALDAWEAELHAGVKSDVPVVCALTDAAHRHRLPLTELNAFMRAMRLDCSPVRIQSWDELVMYMDGSLGSIMRIMASLLSASAEGFGRLGLAFQLANFVRDVREDHCLDRIYLPAEDRERFGVSSPDLAAPRASPEVRALVAHHVTRTRDLFTSAAPAVSAAPRSVRSAMQVAIGLYLRMLDGIEAADFDVLANRPGVRAWYLSGAVRRAMSASDPTVISVGR